jgi:hypothetical protein
VRVEDHVAAVAEVLHVISKGDERTPPSFLVRVEAQQAEHRASGGTRHVYAQELEAKPSKKMRDNGVLPGVGDSVRVLVRPIPTDDYVAVMIAVTRSVTRMGLG